MAEGACVLLQRQAGGPRGLVACVNDTTDEDIGLSGVGVEEAAGGWATI